jgi:hypothetical protein
MGQLKMFAAVASLAASLLAVNPASALVIKYNFTGGVGVNGNTFDPVDPIGTLPAKFLNESAASCNHVANGCTYDFLFNLAGLTPGATTTIEVGAQAHKVTAEPISFDLFKGVPGLVASVANPSNPNFLGASNTGTTSPVLAVNLGDGSYYVQIMASQIAVSGEASSGSLVETIVPEPAAWSMMLLGVGLAGAAIRARRREALTAA